MQFSALLHDTNFFVLLSMIIFLAVVYAKGRKPMMAFLDARTARIKADLEEANRLRLEAQALLADMQKKHRDALDMSQQLINNAKETALRLQQEAAQKLEETQARREKQLLERIARAEASAVDELRAQAADLAAASAGAILQEALQKRGGKVIDDAIADLSSKLN